MKFRNLIIIFIANFRFVFASVKVKEISQMEINRQNSENVQYLGEKKVHFAKGNSQYIKFDVNLPSLLDFAMCLWYKPMTILEHNILFFYGNHNEQLILWKIKKKNNHTFAVLRISNDLIAEEKIDLVAGQWHHLCQYWQASTNLWALFINNYIVSFGFANRTRSNWLQRSANSIATINHPKTKASLHGEIYGFHLVHFTSAEQSNVNIPQYRSKLRKRQTESIPVDAEPAPVFFVGKLFTFIRRMVSFVAVPAFRFVRSLIVPWRKSFSTQKTIHKLPPSSVTEIITDFRSVTDTSKIIKIETAHSPVNSSSTSNEDLVKLEESMVIYEVDSNNDSKYLRDTLNVTNAKNTNIDSMEMLVQPEETINRFRTYSNDVIDKCLLLEQKLPKNRLETTDNIAHNVSDNPTDAITLLGAGLYYMQFLYSCCYFNDEKILLSWDTSKVTTNNVTIQNIAGCGNF